MRNSWLICVMGCLLFFAAGAAPLCAQTKYVRDIRVSGNKQTKLLIILREMTVRIGDKFSDTQLLEERLEASRANILNTSLFNYVYVDAEYPEDDTLSVIIKVKVEERWYIWPNLDFKLEDRNTSAWLKDPSWEKVTVMTGLTINNMRGRNETARVTGKWGYMRAFVFSYQNVALDKKRRHLLGASYFYETQRNVSYITAANEVLYVTSLDGPIKRDNGFCVNYIYRPRMRDYHYVNFNYNHINIQDTVLALNPAYWNSAETSRDFLQLTYNYRSDYRDSYVYPLEGYLFGLLTDVATAVDGESYSLALYPEYQRHIRLAPRWGYSGYTAAKISLAAKDAYVDSRSLGYNNKWLRGYEYYVMDGQYYVMLQNNLKFTLLPTKVVTLNFLSALSKFNKIHFTFYMNAFFDAGYVYNRYKTLDNTLQNSFLYSGGWGLDVVTYYDITLRLDFSVNKMGEKGFYFHIVAPFI